MKSSTHLPADLPEVQSHPHLKRKILHIEDRSDRVIKQPPIVLKALLQIQGIDAPLSLRNVAASGIADSVRLSLGRRRKEEQTSPLSSHIPVSDSSNLSREGFAGSLLRSDMRRKRLGASSRSPGTGKHRETMSTPFLSQKLLSPELPKVQSPRPVPATSKMLTLLKNSFMLKPRLQLHRYAIEFNNRHRILLIRKETPGLRPLRV